MALNIAPILQGVTRLLGGVVDNSAVTDPLTVQSGVTLDGSQMSLLGGVLGQVVGAGVQAVIPGASVTNGGTIQGATVNGTANPGIALTAGGTVVNLAGGVVTGVNAGVAVTGSGVGPSAVSNLGSIAASAAIGVGVALDIGALTNGGTIAAAGAAGVGVTIGSGTLGNAAGGAISGGLNGIASAGNTGITNAGSVLGTAGTGIVTAAGTLTNAVGGTVTGAVDGILNTGTAAIDNAGHVVGTTGTGIGAAGGTLINEIGAVITGATSGVVATAATDVHNLGTILGTAATGVVMAAGTLTNDAGAAITGGTDGILGTGATTVNNAGSILGTAGQGIVTGAGMLTNAATGTISGVLGGVTMTAPSGTVDNLGSIVATGINAIGVNLAGGGTVIDVGTISGTDLSGALGGIAVNLGGMGGSRLVLDPGSVLTGDAVAAGVGNTLELAAGLGTNIVRDIGTTIRGFDTTVLDTGAVAEVLGAVTTLGAMTVGNGAALRLDGAVAAGVSVDLSGQGASLTLGNPVGFAGTIVNLGTDDTLDLGALGTGASVSYDPVQGGLTVTTAGGVASLIPVTLALGLDPASISLTLGNDGAGGTTVTVGTGGGTGGGGTGGGGTGGGGTGTGAGGTGGGGTGMGTGGTGMGGTGGGGTGGAGGTGTTITAGSGSGNGTAGGGTMGTGGTSPMGGGTGDGTADGATIAYGTGLAQGDTISIDPTARFLGHGQFALTGHVASTSGVSNVEISAVVDGGATVDLGTASVAADGSFTFQDPVGAHLQGFITATETNGVGGTTSVASPYSLEAGIRGLPYVAQQELYSPDGNVDKATTNYHPGGNNDVHIHAPGQTFVSGFFDTYLNGGAPENTFVFNPGHGLDVISLFRANGADHDTISLPSADFASVADVLRATQNTAGGAVIHDPTSGDTIKLVGVSKAELKANPADFAFHA